MVLVLSGAFVCDSTSDHVRLLSGCLFPDISLVLLYFRLALQFVFIYWVFSVTLSKRNGPDLVING